VFEIALRQRRRESLLLFARTAFLLLMVLVFSRLWQAVLPAGAEGGPSSVDCVWYLLITECVLLSQPRIFLEIERDVRGGELAYLLTRPASYLGCKLSEGMAEIALAMSGLIAVGAPFSYLLAGGLPRDPRGLLFALPLALLASLLGLLCSTLIGLSSFWVTDCSPLQWLWQKSGFVLGGLFVPLALYPEWLREIALLTPFSALLYGPASMAFGFDPSAALHVALKLSFWIGLALCALYFTHRRGLRIVDLHGG
jgi:ABC-2 type transport system permease protein